MYVVVHRDKAPHFLDLGSKCMWSALCSSCFIPSMCWIGGTGYTPELVWM